MYDRSRIKTQQDELAHTISQQITHELAIDEVFIITTQRSFLSVHAAIKIPTEGLLLRGT